jgi:DNA repair photolyase
MIPQSNPCIKETTAKSLLRKNKKIDSWFISRYGMNIYRGCFHNCTYCDGRSEKYRVEGEFGKEIAVKTNAIQLLSRELDPAKKRVPMKPGFIMVGGGVGDAYQPVEKEYQLTRQALEMISRYNHPVHILTKSTLVERDLDLVSEISRKSGAIVSISFSSVDDGMSRQFEPGVPTPSHRLNTLKRFKEKGVTTGMFLMPVIPLITDSNSHLESALIQAKQAGVDFVIFSSMTLKRGRQLDHYMSFLKDNWPHLVPQYNELYKDGPWGQAEPEYHQDLHHRLFKAARQIDLPLRIPFHIFKNIIDGIDLITVILEQMDYLLKMAGKKSLYGWAAFNISKQKDFLNLSSEEMVRIKGVGPTTVSIIEEILKTGRCRYYERLLYGRAAS